ncbi:recombinase family protein [Actinokineospora sp. HUAS TT18]|uniref:recombinase family protein n=1 Tax=Actinokineospora sp. HUAS TT18 TaxID=3447451 RepID=UPI003F51F26B
MKKNKAVERITGDDYVAYLRVSTPGQVNTDYNPEGISIPAQREKVAERGQEIGANKVAEFVDPGRSAKTIDQRPEFQQMIKYLRENPNVRYVIVYMLSRFARNRLDDALMMSALEKLGVTLVSAVEKNIDNTPTGRMLHGMLAVINEYSSHQNGEDVRYKMGMKAKGGGTISRAPVGYLNTVQHIEDRQVKTVMVDPVRGPLIRLTFELYATNEWTLADLADELFERGLRMSRNSKYPERQISISRLADLLRDDYYIGWITYEGEKFRGRHKPLIDPELFEQVQQIINSRSATDERRREHFHYLKGLFCGVCLDQRGEQRRLIFQNATNRHGTTYQYFFCTGRYDHVCELPYLRTERVEEAIEQHYATIQFDETFIAEVREHMAQAVGSQESSARQLHQQLSAQLKALDVKESNLIDLASDGSLPQTKIREKLHAITKQRDRLTARLGETTQDLSEAAALVDLCLELLRDPQGLYLRCSDEQRRLLNQAFFEVLYLHEETDGELTITYRLQEPFAELQALQQGAELTSTNNSTPVLADEGAGGNALTALLANAWLAKGSSRACMVGAAGFEPATARV